MAKGGAAAQLKLSVIAWLHASYRASNSEEGASAKPTLFEKAKPAESATGTLWPWRRMRQEIRLKARREKKKERRRRLVEDKGWMKAKMKLRTKKRLS